MRNGKTVYVDTRKISSLSYTHLFSLTKEMAPGCRMMAYFIKDDGEFVADSKVLNIGYDLTKKVRVVFLTRLLYVIISQAYAFSYSILCTYKRFLVETQTLLVLKSYTKIVTHLNF